MSDRLWK